MTDSTEKDEVDKDAQGFLLPPGMQSARQSFLTASAPLVQIQPLAESPSHRTHSNTLAGESVKETPLKGSLRMHQIDDWNGRFQKCVNEVKNSKGLLFCIYIFLTASRRSRKTC